jgi:putative cell wall-binding protein
MSDLKTQLNDTLKGLGSLLNGLDTKLSEIENKVPQEHKELFQKEQKTALDNINKAGSDIAKALQQLKDIKI